MLTTHDPITTRDHLIDLARALTEADGQDPPDPARVGQLAWQILAELNEAAFGRIDAEVLLAQAQTAARAAAADAVSGSPARCPQLTERRDHGVQVGLGNELMHP